MSSNFAAFLGEPFEEGFVYSDLREAEGGSRPIGSTLWLKVMQEKLGIDTLPISEDLSQEEFRN